MSVFVYDSAHDAYLNQIANNADVCLLCSGNPADYATAVTNTLADVALTVGDGNGDYTVGNGSPDGRALTIAQQADILIDASGTAAVVVLTDGTSVFIAKTDLSATQALTANGSNTVTINSWTITVRDAA